MNNNLFEQILKDAREALSNNFITEASDKCFTLASDIKNKIANYKKNIDLLDDCIFVDVLDELAYFHIDLKQFDELLNKEQLTESEGTYVCYLIDFTSSLIQQHILNKIKNLSELLDNF